MKFSILTTTISAIAIFPIINAQDITSALGGLSTSCQSSAISLVTGSSGFGTCANIVGLVSVLSASGSIITPLNSWLTGACSQTCSSAVLANATSSINTGCASDIASGTAIAVGLETLVSNYTQVKDVLCLQATSNSTFCLTNLLTAVQSATGTNLSVSTITSLLSGGLSSLVDLASQVPTSSLCTDCTHAQISKLSALSTSTSTSSTSAYSAASSGVSSKCGATFVDGKIPSTVKEAGSTASNSAVSSTPLSAAPTLMMDKKVVAVVVGMVGFVGLGAWSALF